MLYDYCCTQNIIFLLFLYVLFSIYKYPLLVASLIGIVPLWQPSDITCILYALFYILCWKIKYDDDDDDEYRFRFGESCLNPFSLVM